MSQIQLRPNRVPLMTTVILRNGKTARFTAEPGQLLFDENDYVRFFSMMRQDGSTHNLQLLPIKLLSSVVEFAKNWLVPYGLSIVSGEVINEVDGTAIDDVARFISENVANNFIVENFFEINTIGNFAYYDVVTGHLIVTEALKVNFLSNTAESDRLIR